VQGRHKGEKPTRRPHTQLSDSTANHCVNTLSERQQVLDITQLNCTLIHAICMHDFQAATTVSWLAMVLYIQYTPTSNFNYKYPRLTTEKNVYPSCRLLFDGLARVQLFWVF